MITLPWSKPPLAQNDRQHHMVKAKAFAKALEEARAAIRQARTLPVVGANVTLHYRVKDRRRRDPDGIAPTLKACLDALVAEGVLPDDSWVCVPAVTCRIHPPIRDMPPAMWLTLDTITHYNPEVTP